MSCSNGGNESPSLALSAGILRPTRTFQLKNIASRYSTTSDDRQIRNAGDHADYKRQIALGNHVSKARRAEKGREERDRGGIRETGGSDPTWEREKERRAKKE